MNYECHITLKLAQAGIGARVAETHHWKTSEIARDPVLGKDTYFYLTSHAATYEEMQRRLDAAVLRLKHLGAEVIRTKIELIVFDWRLGCVPVYAESYAPTHPGPRKLEAYQADPVEPTKPKMSPWVVVTDPKTLRRLGKAGEEVNELGSVLARCIIQGIDEIDPSSGKTNRLRLEEEIADVYAQCNLNIKHLGLRDSFIERRAIEKMTQMKEWEGLCNPAPHVNPTEHEQTR